MTERNQNDNQLNDYLNGKSPLSVRYRQLEGGQPSAAVDASILQAARHEVSTKRHQRSWTVPAAIAALVLLGISVMWWQQRPTPPALTNTDSAAPMHERTLPAQVDSNLHNNPDADAWLTRILKLQRAGKATQAAEEFRKFRQSYPVYSIDQKRFGSLKQYDQ